LRLGKYLLRGLRFLFSLTFDWIRRFAQTIRRKLRNERPAEPPLAANKWKPQHGSTGG
jgi:hypothetical protein